MTFLGKILVFLNTIMSILFMAFALMVYSSRVEYAKKVDGLQSQITSLRGEVGNATREKDEAVKKLQDSESKGKSSSNTSQKEVDELKAELDRMRKEAEASKAESEQALAQMKSATTEQKQRREEVMSLREKLEDSLQKVAVEVSAKAKTEDQLAQRINELEVTNARNQQLNDQIKQLQAYIVRIRGELPAMSELEQTSDGVPPAPDVEGIVSQVDSSGRFIQISLGKDDGIRQGQTLEVWRLKPEPKYLGQLKVYSVEATNAVCKPVSVTGLIQVNDRVGPRVTTYSN